MDILYVHRVLDLSMVATLEYGNTDAYLQKKDIAQIDDI